MSGATPVVRDFGLSVGSGQDENLTNDDIVARSTVKVVGNIGDVVVIEGLKEWQRDPPYNLQTNRLKLERRVPGLPPAFHVLMPKVYQRFSCPKCGNHEVEVLRTDDYETSVFCPKCKTVTLVHRG